MNRESVDAFLAAVDGVLGPDIDTSADAMRWAPEMPTSPPPAPNLQLGFTAPGFTALGFEESLQRAVERELWARMIGDTDSTRPSRWCNRRW